MRLLNEDTDCACNRISLFLTNVEAQELRTILDDLLEAEPHRHEHLSSADYKKELTICLYDDNSLDHFDERARRLIVQDE